MDVALYDRRTSTEPQHSCRGPAGDVGFFQNGRSTKITDISQFQPKYDSRDCHEKEASYQVTI